MVEEVVVMTTNQEGACEKGANAGVSVTTDLAVGMVWKPPEHHREPEPAEPKRHVEEEPYLRCIAK